MRLYNVILNSAGRRRLLNIAAIITMAVTFCACDESLLFDHYQPVDVQGWERSDTLNFDAGIIPATADYELDIGFRATQAYPYKDVAFKVVWTIYPKGTTASKSIKCNVFSDEGRMEANNGISSGDFLYRVTTIRLNRGDSVTFKVCHDMNQDIIPGLTGAGLQLRR